MKYINRLLLIILLLIFSVQLQSQDKKISIAIMDFQANNTDETLGGACADMLAEKLFSSKLFILMEKSQMDKIARRNGFYEFNSTDPVQIKKLGKILNVEKLLSGSITYLDTYIINVKVFDAVTGEIDFTVEERVSSAGKIDDAIAGMALAVERHYLGYYNLSGDFDINAEFLYVMPFGSMADAVGSGIGGQVFVTLNTPFDLLADLQLMTGYYSFTPACDGIEAYNVVPLSINCAWKFSPARNIRFIPALGAGYIFTLLSSDTDGTGLYDYSKKFHYNPAVTARAEFDIFLADRWYVTVTPQYALFFVPGDFGQFAALGLGLRMLF